MKTFLCLLFLCPLVFAESVTSTIYEIDVGNKNEMALLKLDSGRVVFVSPKQVKILKSLKEQWKNKILIEVEVNEQNQLVRTQISKEQWRPVVEDYVNFDSINYEPTIVPNMEEAQKVFSRMRRSYQNESQCFNRAHIWTFEAFKKTGLYSKKIFLFFTNRYIRNYRYHWWFHVSPMITVATEQGVFDKVIDRRYTRGPLSIKAWTDVFVYSHRNCPVAEKYSEYRRNQSIEHCYIMPRSMYFYHPSDMSRQERTGSIRTEFGAGRISEAYREAF